MLGRLPNLLILLLALGMLSQAVPLIISSWNMLKVDFFLDDWQTRGHVPSSIAWDTAYQANEKSRSWSPVENGLHFSQQGELYLWHAYSLNTDEPESRLRSAIKAFEKDAQLRPTWPYPILELLSLELRLNEGSDQYDEWVDAFLKTAHWRGKLLGEFVSDAVNYWPVLNHHQRRIVLETTAQALEMDRSVARSLRSQLDALQLRPLFCLYLSIQPVDSSQLCR